MQDMHRTQALKHRDLFNLLLSIVATATLSSLTVHGFEISRLIFLASIAVTGALAFLVIFKLFSTLFEENNKFQIIPNAMVLFIFAIALIRLSISGFDEDDEIYSWNMWAIQHFSGQLADFKFTVAPYPQLFSYWIGGLYQAMGGYTFQSLPRAFLSLPTLILAASLAITMKAHSWKSSVFISIVIFFALAPVIAWMARGLADPLMSAAMVLSALALYRYYQDPKDLHSLIIALVAAVISALTKQAGIFWACVSIPIFVIFGVYKWNWPRVGLIYCAIAMVGALIWPALIAPTFINNHGVVAASTEGRTVAQQMLFSFKEYILIRPYFIAIYAVVIWALFKAAFVRVAFVVAVLPMLLLWFQFGAYSLRLGIHVVGLSALLATIGYSQIMRPGNLENLDKTEKKNDGRKIFISTFAITILYLFGLFLGVIKVAEATAVDLFDGAKTTIGTQWRAEGVPIFERVMRENETIWVASSYAYGALYGRANLIEPQSSNQSPTQETLSAELLKSGAHYVIYSELIPMPPYTDMIKTLISQCPDAFEPLLGPDNQKQFRLFKLNSKFLSMKSCQNSK